MAISFKGAHFPKEVILMGVRWYVASVRRESGM
jgi:transposase-like protein